MEIPVVCNPLVFTEAQRDRHFDLSKDVLLRWPQSRAELPDGYLFSYQADEERFRTLAGWAAAEHVCCPWATYSVELGPSSNGVAAIRVRVVGTAEGKAFLTAAYRYLAELEAGGAAPPPALLAQSITREAIPAGSVKRCGC